MGDVVGWSSFGAFIALLVAYDEYANDFADPGGLARGLAAPALALLLGVIALLNM